MSQIVLLLKRDRRQQKTRYTLLHDFQRLIYCLIHMMTKIHRRMLHIRQNIEQAVRVHVLRHIAGRIDYHEAAQQLQAYHRDNPEQTQHFEADIVAQRISELLQTPGFAFSPSVLKAIHSKLFQDVFTDAEGKLRNDWVGVWRTENIVKSEPVLHGESVQYSDAVYGLNQH